ncbi:unnamed protein product [Durusdinium trenchii]|uniref:BTB domain-containing protein n=1 Tax=Durusdinium trenchii TaxID=1381693 RepID=A0ABP0SZM5_9DINO
MGSKSDLNEKWSPSIRDDVRSARDTLKFPKGTLSFVAKGPDARTTQVMISLSDLTGRLGHNPWETPIGHVLEEDFPVLDQFFTGYQDAIEEEELLKRGNGYLQEFFPRASPSNAHYHGTSPIGAQTSPRPVLAMHSPVSPHRTTRSGWGHATGNDSSVGSLAANARVPDEDSELLERLTAAAECRWTTQELTFVPESRTPMTSVSAGYPPAMNTSEPREPPPASAAAAAAAEAAAAAAWPALRAFEEPTEGPAEQVQVDQGSAETSSARGQSEAEPMKSPMNSPRTVAVTGVPVSEKPWEVTVDDEPEVFLEMIRFVYLNTCHVDQGNVKALMHIADKYCIEDIVKHCLQWMQDNFTVGLFYHLLTVQMSHEHFGRLLWNSLLKALRSRRHFALVTADAEEHFEKLPVSFVEALLRSDELPVISEIEASGPSGGVLGGWGAVFPRE